ncbi:ABC transporter substrate-binding protein [bacterium]|nr:ABC transporter substrate-binding protein [bacterium]QQR59960.1 MAG: ABC transporter substrate-binding protein [Candidatus Melainabacteria bacterium]
MALKNLARFVPRVLSSVLSLLFLLCLIFFASPHKAWAEAKNFKIVSLAPSNTELIYSLGGEDKLYGVSSFCHVSKPVVGSFISASYEKLAVIKPDVILLVQGQEALAFQLRHRHYNVEILPNEKIQDISDNLKKIGRLLDLQNDAIALSKRFDTQIDSLKQITKTSTLCKTLVCVWAEPIICVGKKSFINDLITACGGINVLSAKNLGYSRISHETLLSSRPNLIILPNEAMGSNSIKKLPWTRLCHRPGVTTFYLPKNRADFLSRPSLQVVDGLAWLATKQHPKEKLRINQWLDATKLILFKKNIKLKSG